MARAEGDIVITVGGNVSPLTDAVTKAERTLGKLNTATQRADKQFRAMVGTSTEMQARIDALSGVTDRLGKSAERSAEAFAAFDRSKAAVDRLRASYDPVFAASKRYEAAVEQLDEALRRGVITQGQYATMTAKLGQSMLTVEGQASRAGVGLFSMGRGASNLTMQVQNASYQVGDFFVQIASGTDATRALAQQLPQLLGGFGMFGAVAGAAVAIGGALVPMFLGAGAEAKTLEDRTNDLNSALSKFNASVDASRAPIKELTAQYGRFADEVQRALSAIVEADQRVLAAEFAGAIKDISDAYSGLFAGLEVGGETSYRAMKKLEDQLRMNSQEVLEFKSAVLELQAAETFAQQAAAALKVMEAIDNARDSAGRLPPVLQQTKDALARLIPAAAEANAKINQMEGLLDAAARAADGAADAVDGIGSAVRGAYRDVASLVGKMWEMGQARIAANDKLGQMAIEFSPGGQNQMKWGGRGALTPEQKALADRYNPDGSLKDTKKGRGGGGKKGEDYAAKLEQFNQSLMTEAELELAQYQTRQEQLQTFLDQKLLTQEEYNAKLEQLQQQHQDRMAAIDAYRYGDGLQKAGAFLGDMAAALQGGNEKMQKIAQKFAAAETLINAWRAYSQTLADPTLPFWAKIPAALKVLAAGFGAVNAIKGGGGGKGSVAASSGSTPAAPAQAPLEVRLRGDGSAIGWGDLGTLLTKLNEEAGDRGYRLLVAQ